MQSKSRDNVKFQHRVQSNVEVIYAYIADYMQRYQRPPTVREIAAACYVGVGTVARYLDKLEAKGWITRAEGKARGIMLTKEGK